MNTSFSNLNTNRAGIDKTISCDRAAELFGSHKSRLFVGPEGGLTTGIKASIKIIEQRLQELEMYRDCVIEANTQLKNSMKVSMKTKRGCIPTEKQDDIERYASAILLAYDQMVDAIIFRAHKLKMKQNNNLSFSMRYTRIIENAIQDSITVTNQLIDFSRYIRP